MVLDEVTEVGVLLLADGRLERDRLLRDPHHTADLVERYLHAVGDLFGRRLPTQLLDQAARGTNELIQGLDHVDRDADGSRLVGDGAGDGLPNPPGRIGGELVAPAILELVDGAHEAEVALLDEIEEL